MDHAPPTGVPVVGDSRQGTPDPGRAERGAGPDSPGPLPAVDTGALDALCDLAGNLSLVAELIDTYLADQRRVGAVLRQALAAQDPDRLFRAAHSLKSSSASLGATPLSRLYAEAERLGRAGTLAGAEAAVERIEGEAQRVEVALRAWLAARPADSQAG